MVNMSVNAREPPCGCHTILVYLALLILPCLKAGCREKVGTESKIKIQNTTMIFYGQYEGECLGAPVWLPYNIGALSVTNTSLS